jgi:hypothetical protein
MLTIPGGSRVKRVIPFSFQAFPFAFLGGNRVLRIVSKEAEAKGAKALPGSSVQRMFHNLDKGIERASTEIGSRL